MVKKMGEPDIAALAKKEIFQKIADGDWYQYGHEPKLQAIVKHSAQVIQHINDVAKTDQVEALKQLHAFLPHLGKDVEIYFPITGIEYPGSLYVGDHSFINSGLQFLSAAKVTIGQYCFIGPNCRFFTPNHHPTNKQLRRDGWQYDLPITIGDDCWFGGDVIFLPGVTVGNNVVIGAGSVVTKDLPDNVIAAGNPARIIRHVDAEN
ncbi:sugar O-acetyltransferase [Levilactobacillus namurensis]|uniref:sugar O-acetyltransferase n=1 Tax=Levilactobacillus namurensis TaxID=380393 RepID=UPI001DD5D53B|nr:sugar O-acetyltransferase [Levilactobacillus namurensis]HJE46089.1 sugar O-acetyltransferase [Levilactobacillus namurensis]